ncbi:hypothetical protein [Streptomyces sp. JJ38]|uniref:hypothetical protein n=1 Tax=Streptomyces sp. JJ38 TaxID=2738128 RepID=UPI001C5A55BA|nr:hypothetical protein [Streptomyces sp. JJ38]MBW1597804.1 hypothetical protein [Streptomyces sp. JJ38]
MRLKHRANAIAAGVLISLTAGAGVAHAEGFKDTWISGWLPGKESSHWKDRNLDGTSTSIKFAKCSGTSDTNPFRYAGLQLKKERSWSPDPVVARDNNYCDTSYFGDRSAGGYYFNYTTYNGSNRVRSYLNVKDVTIRW